MSSHTSFPVQMLVVLGLAALLPLAVIPVSWLGVEHAKIAVTVLAVVIGAIVWGISILKRGSIEAPRTWLLAGLAILPLAYLLSAVIAHPTMESFLGSGLERDTVMAMLLWPSIAFLAAFSIKRIEGVRAIHLTIIGATLIAVVIQIIRLWWPSLLMGASGAASATLPGSWHDLISLVGLSVLLSAGYLGSRTVTGVWRGILSAMVVVGLAIMLMASFRDIWIVLAVISSITAVLITLRGTPVALASSPAMPDPMQPRADMYPPQMQQLQQSVFAQASAIQSRRIPLIAVALISIVFAIFGGTIHDRLPDTFRILQFEVRPSWDGTMTVITSVWSEGKVIFGSGPNTFAHDWARHKPLAVNETPFWEVGFAQGVGLVPTSLATVGIVGGAAWAAFLLLFLWLSARIIMKAQNTDRYFVTVAVMATVYMWAINVFYVPSVGLVAFSFLLVGVLIALGRITNVVGVKELPLGVRSASGFAVAGVALVIFGAMFVASAGTARAALADAILNRAIIDYQTDGNLAIATSRVERALTLYPSDRSHRAAVELGLLQLQQALLIPEVSEEDKQRIQTVLEQTIQHGLAAVIENEGDLQNWLTLARTYEELAGVQVQGAFEQATAVYERARDAHPTSPVPYFKLAQIAVAQNNLPVAQALLDEALKRKQTYLPAHLLRARIFASQNDAQAAVASMQAVVQLAPNEPGAWYEFGALLFAVGDIQNAATALQQAVTLEPSYANAWFVLARIYAGVGDRTSALAALEKVRALNPENQEVLSAIEQVRSMNVPSTTGTGTTTATTTSAQTQQ